MRRRGSAVRLAATCALIALTAGAQATKPAAPTTALSRTAVVMLGSGTPAADPDRFGSAVVIVVDSTPYLFDAGVGVVRRWAAATRQGIAPPDPSSLRRAFFTHLHSDHTLGFPELIFSSWTLDPDHRPLDVYGPRGLNAMTQHIIAAWAEDIAIRTSKDGESEGDPAPVVRVHEVGPGVVYHDSLVTITAFLVPHGTWAQAFGYRIQTPDKVIVLSGDTAPTDAIVEQCNGCDILLHEGGSFTDARSSPYFRRFHTTAEQLARIATRASPKLLVLYHQRPRSPDVEKSYRTLRALYRGAFVVASDLDVFR